MKEKKVSKSVEKIIKLIAGLEPAEFIGVCKILGVEILQPTEAETDEKLPSRESKEDNQKRNINVKVRPAEELIVEVIDKVDNLNRAQRRNLLALLRGR